LIWHYISRVTLFFSCPSSQLPLLPIHFIALSLSVAWFVSLCSDHGAGAVEEEEEGRRRRRRG